MILGNGLIAKSFASFFGEDQDVIVFATGVSNSREIQSEAFLRESSLLRAALRLKKKLIYFSTCSIEDPQLQGAPYVLHKVEMEALVSECNGNCIFRLPQVVGKTSNPYTLANYLHHQILTESSFQIWQHAKRNLIDVDDLAVIVNCLVRSEVELKGAKNIATPFSVSILQLVKIFELILKKKANYTLVDSGGSYPIDSTLTQQIASKIGISFDSGYIERLIRKYYGN